MSLSKFVDTLKLHVVLDLDGTIYCRKHKKARPRLKEFLAYLFLNHKSVNIWTANKPQRLEHVFQTLLKPILAELPGDPHFGLMWCGDRCESTSRMRGVDGFPSGGGTWYKPLSLMFNEQRANGMYDYNTLIIDDTPTTYLNNPANGVHIPTYEYNPDEPDANDDALMNIVECIKRLKEGMLLQTDKRYFYQSIESSRQIL